MATRLRQIVQFVNAPVGVAVLPHGINIDQVQRIPDTIWVRTDGTPIDVAADANNVTLTNNSGGPVNVDCWLYLDHTIDRAWPAPPGPQPIIFICATGGGPPPSTTWAFTYVCTGLEGDDFFIPLPAVRADDNYIPTLTCGGFPMEMIAFDCPDIAAPDRTTTQFRVVATAAPRLDDRIDVLIHQRTH